MKHKARRDLQWFFNDWVYRDRGLPDFRLPRLSRESAGNDYMVTVTVENSGDAGAEVPVTLKMDEGQSSKGSTAGKSKAIIRTEAHLGPRKIE